MITVYTLPTCQNCHFLMEWLDKQGVEYTELNAKKNPDITTTPTIDIAGERIIGFDRLKIKRALKKYGKK